MRTALIGNFWGLGKEKLFALCVITHRKKSSDGLFERRKRLRAPVTYSNKLARHLLVPWWHTTRIVSAGVCDSLQKGIFLWLMVCLLGAVGCLPLPVEPWQSLPRSELGLCWAALPLPWSPVYSKAANRASMRSCSIPCSTLHYSTVPHCTLHSCQSIFMAWHHFSTLPRTETGEITQHLRKRFDSSAAPPV